MNASMKFLKSLVLLISIFLVGCTTQKDEFRVGMEANYAPYNWTQPNQEEGTAPIEDGGYAGGYDVSIAQKIADQLGKKLVVVKLDWDGLIPSLQAGKIDAIVAGMSPTEERRQEIDFSNNYYTAAFVLVTRKDSSYSQAKTLNDFKGAKITGQLGTLHYDLIDQINGVVKEEAMSDFSAMRVALESGKIDAYIAEKTTAIDVSNANDMFKMITFEQGQGFDVSPEQASVAIGVKKDSPLTEKINGVLGTISEDERKELMDKAIRGNVSEIPKNFFSQMWQVFQLNAPQLFEGAFKTLTISLIGTIIGLFIGLIIGIIRTMPQSTHKVKRFCYKILNGLLSVYIEVFRGTPMIVQAMVVYYGSSLMFGFDLDKTVAALLIVSVNTGAYMSEVVRGGIVSIDKGQFEAARAIGMSHIDMMKYIIMPQVMKNILPATGNEFVINIKDTSVLNVIGVTELYFVTRSIASTNYQFFQTFLVTCIFYFVMTFTVTRLLRFAEKKLRGKSEYVLASGQNQVESIKE